MSEAISPPRLAVSAFVTCECGRRMKRGMLTQHKAKTCPWVENAHCQHCSLKFVNAVTERIRRGEVLDAIAKALGRTLRDVQDTRRRARAAGCLPRPTPEEEAAEHEAIALARHGVRECTECGTKFTPRINTPQQEACGPACREKRKTRIKHEQRAQGMRHHEIAADAPAKTLAKEMEPLAAIDALFTHAADKAASMMLTGEAHYALWWSVLGVRA